MYRKSIYREMLDAKMVNYTKEVDSGTVKGNWRGG